MELTLRRSAWLALLAVVAPLASSGMASAATYTWTGTSSPGTNNWFSSGSTLNSNWSSPGATLVSADTVVFGTTSRATAAQNSNSSITGLVFDAPAPAYNITGVGSVTLTVTGSIVNQSAFTQTIAPNGSLNIGPGLLIDTGAAGITVSRNLALSSGNFTKQGTGTLTFSASSMTGYTGTATISSGTFDTSAGTFGGSIVIGSGATVFANGVNGGITNNAGGNLTLANSAQVLLASTLSGTTELAGTAANVTFGQSLTLASTGDLKLDFSGASGVAGAADSITAQGLLTYGGTLALNFATSGTVENYQEWQIFLPNGGVSGTFDAITPITSLESQYNGLAWGLAATSANYYDTKYGAGVWLSDWSTGGQRFVFNQNSGTLTIVPEPSTIVFAGIGAAMLGWQTWAGRRRKARMKLVEEHTRTLSAKRGLA